MASVGGIVAYHFNWHQPQTIRTMGYTCGYCGHRVGPNQGYLGQASSGHKAYVYICPHCSKATFVDEAGKQTPAIRLGGNVKGIQHPEVAQLYDEARDCTAAGAYTGAVLLCRKILMNVAVKNGAPENKHFIEYVNWLDENGFVPPNGKKWVDHIREKGNEATHEIPSMTHPDADQILTFTELLLRFVYEFESLLGTDAT